MGADARVMTIQEAADEIAKKYQEHLESIARFFNEESSKTKLRFEERAKVAENKADTFSHKVDEVSLHTEDRVSSIRTETAEQVVHWQQQCEKAIKEMKTELARVQVVHNERMRL